MLPTCRSPPPIAPENSGRFARPCTSRRTRSSDRRSSVARTERARPRPPPAHTAAYQPGPRAHRGEPMRRRRARSSAPRIAAADCSRRGNTASDGAANARRGIAERRSMCRASASRRRQMPPSLPSCAARAAAAGSPRRPRRTTLASCGRTSRWPASISSRCAARRHHRLSFASAATSSCGVAESSRGGRGFPAPSYTMR